MLKTFYQWLFGFIGVRDLYKEIVVKDRLTDIRPKIRADLESLLTKSNESTEFFRGKFTDFLASTQHASDDEFFAAYAKLPALTKQDYAEAGQSVMTDKWADVDPTSSEFTVEGKPWESIRKLRGSDYLMQMATGGSTSMPLAVTMTKHHMFSMLFTFFKCWYRMGWRPGERMLVFYPKNTYNIDDMVKFNPYSKFVGFKYHLFDKIDEQTVRGLVDDINKYKPKLLLVFPSPMNMIAHTIRKLGLELKHHPELINVSGETFFDCQRQHIESVFTRSKVEDSYGSVELGELAHETDSGLEIFANVAYVETAPNDAGQPEMIITRLELSDFPFIRYKMKDIADVEFRQYPDGTEKYVITKIEGKDSNFIMSDRGERFYPSFFNVFVNELNAIVNDSIIEIKVYERGQVELEIQYILRDASQSERVESETRRLLAEKMSDQMKFDIRFVDFIDHDYRRKYRVIERIGDIEFAGGMVGDQAKQQAISEIVSQVTPAGGE
ncbi:MAG: phenylacetate-coenzyme A ligase PaaK-like adenylate-forming protein [Mariniblastus sp.]|jgi:phenylacetate-coenzyme A ligase PaaK-like adenylate-forming protein